MAVTNQDILNALERMQGRDGNGTAVTLAVVKTRLDSVETKLDTICGEFKKDHERLIKVEGKVALFTIAQGIFTTLAASIAGWLGIRN